MNRITKNNAYRLHPVVCGERGIRTPGGVTLNGFQDRRNRPLCHLSKNGRKLCLRRGRDSNSW